MSPRMHHFIRFPACIAAKDRQLFPQSLWIEKLFLNVLGFSLTMCLLFHNRKHSKRWCKGYFNCKQLTVLECCKMMEKNVLMNN